MPGYGRRASRAVRARGLVELKRGARVEDAVFVDLDGGRVDDIISVAWDDDGKSHGPVWNHRGWIGLRQMGHTTRCEYDFLKVFPLKP